MRPLEQDFTISEALPTHRAVVVLRGRRKRDGLPVVLKHPAADIPTEAEIARLKYEYEVLCELQKVIAEADVVKPVELWGQGEKITLVLHDLGGVSLDHYTRADRLPVAEILEIADKILIALQQVHDAGILHKDINPRNIIYARQTKQIQIIDYGIAARTHQETSTTAQLAVEGTLVYAPPEQLGRVSRHADHRTDYYSFGATLYELVCGGLPFSAEDDAQLMHAVLTQRPVAPHERETTVPPALSAIIMKLMEKSQESRYQSIVGIRADLARCARLLADARDTSAALPFELGTEDLDETFVLPNRFYGRDAEMAILREAYAVSADTKRAIVFLGGPSGVGKSAMAVELHAEMLSRHGRFLAGKCDQLRRHLPFSALSQALSGMMRSILLEPPTTAEHWRRRIRANLGGSVQALFEVVPSLEWLLGAHEPAPVIPAQQSDNRLHFLLQALVSTISADCSLVIFLDDLQWADTGTIRFLQEMATSTVDTAGICLIAAYRNDEISPESSFAHLKRALTQGTGHCYDLQLSPMSLDSTCALVADTTRQPRANSDALGALVHQKTGGNPFFTREYLLYLRQKDHLKLEPRHRFWTWDLQAIDATPVTDNVVVLLTRKLSDLPPHVQRSLSIAACLGNQFQLDALLDICKMSRATLVAAMSTSVLQGLLLANASDYRYAAHTHVDVSYKFAHDRVQQAAFGLLNEETAAQAHFDIGHSMWTRWRADSAAINIFDLLAHLNAASGLAASVPERLALAELNLTGAKEAKRAAAHNIARDYLDWAWQLLGTAPWVAHPALARQVQLEVMDCEINAAQLDAALVRLDEMVPHCHDVIEHAELDVRRVYVLSTANRNKDAVAAGLEGLRRLNYRFVGRSRILLVFNAVITLIALRRHGTHTIPRMPFTTSRRIELIVDLMSGMALPSYYVDQDIYALLAVRAPRLTLRYGLTRMSGYAVGAFGVAMIQQLDDFAFAARMATIARAIIHAHAGAAYRAAIEWVTTVYVDYLKLPLSVVADQNQNAYELGKMTGDPLFCGWSAAFAPAIYLMVSLRRVREGHASSEAYVTTLGERAQVVTMASLASFVQLLTGEIALPLYDVAAYRKLSEEEAATGHANDLIIRLVANWMLRDEDRVWSTFVACTRVDIFRGCIEYLAPYFSFYGCLAVCERVRQGKKIKRKERALFSRMRAKLRAIASYGSRHFCGIDLLIEGHWCATRGRDTDATDFFDKGLTALDASEFVALRASAFESVARFYIERGHPMAAVGYLNHAMELYRLWGASGKVSQLRREFAARLPAVATPTIEATDVPQSRHATGSARHSTNVVAGMQMTPLRRLAQALNARSTHDALAHEALACLNEATSATRSIIVLYREGASRLYFDTERGIGRPLAILDLAARSAQILCVEDAAHDKELRLDAYVAQYRPKGLLCMPMMRGDSMLGMVYLENTTTAGTFTPDCVRLLELLVPQITVAFENRTLSEAMDQRVQAHIERIQGTSEKLLMVEKDRTEARMAGGFAHEMRNALSSAGYVMPLLLETNEFGRADDSVDAAVQSCLAQLREQPTGEALTQVLARLNEQHEIWRGSQESIARAIRRGMKITDQVMEYAQASRIIASAESVRLDALVQQIVSEHQASFNELQIACRVQIDHGIVCHIGEPHAYAVVRNLIANARDALSSVKDGRARLIAVTATTYSGGVRLDVADNGPGMAPELQKRTFEPFFTTKGSQGSGLGLGLSRKILAAYGGRIDFSTELAAGTTFTVELPD